LQATKESSAKHSTILPNVTNDLNIEAVSVKELYLKLKMSYPANGKRLTEIKKNPLSRAVQK
jgi:hypothetical protein